MTQTIDQTSPKTWPTPQPAAPSGLAVDYLRRIHWWVRLFGIIWIVIPIVTLIIGGFFMIGVASRATTNNPGPSASYSRCIDQGLFSAAECARMYPR